MSKHSLLPYIEKFQDFKILVIGDVVLDHYVFGKVERLNPEAPVPILHVQKEKEMTGAAGNVAKNAAALGATVTLIGVVGNDESAKRVKQAAEAENYESRVVVDYTRPTIRKNRYLVGSQQLLRVDFEETHDIAADVETKLIEEITAAAVDVDAIIISDYAKGVVTKAVAEAVLAAGKEKNIMIAADIKPSRAAFVKGATFISPNLKEGHEFLGLNPLEHSKKDPAEIAKLLHQKMETDVFLTLGAGGVYVEATDGTSQHVPQEHVAEVFDVSGAGDTAIVALVLSRLAGASVIEAAEISNAAGAVVVGKVGSVGLTQEEIKNMLEHKHS